MIPKFCGLLVAEFFSLILNFSSWRFDMHCSVHGIIIVFSLVLREKWGNRFLFFLRAITLFLENRVRPTCFPPLDFAPEKRGASWSCSNTRLDFVVFPRTTAAGSTLGLGMAIRPVPAGTQPDPNGAGFLIVGQVRVG